MAMGVGRVEGIGTFPCKSGVCASALENKILIASISAVKVDTKREVENTRIEKRP